MERITVHKKVFWSANDRMLSGKVKQVMSDHVLVETASGNHLVRKAALSCKPIGKIASLMKLAVLDGIKGFEIEFDPATNQFKWKHVDKMNAAGGIPPCKRKENKLVADMDAIWEEDTSYSSGPMLNPELFRQLPPQVVPPVKAPVKPKAVQAPPVERERLR